VVQAEHEEGVQVGEDGGEAVPVEGEGAEGGQGEVVSAPITWLAGEREREREGGGGGEPEGGLW
jgi:hypothetical protein